MVRLFTNPRFLRAKVVFFLHVDNTRVYISGVVVLNMDAHDFLCAVHFSKLFEKKPPFSSLFATEQSPYRLPRISLSSLYTHF